MGPNEANPGKAGAGSTKFPQVPTGVTGTFADSKSRLTKSCPEPFRNRANETATMAAMRKSFIKPALADITPQRANVQTNLSTPQIYSATKLA
jgi:hypothetical protein